MFQTLKTVGRFNVTTSPHDPLHHRRRRSEDRRETFFDNELKAERWMTVYAFLDNLPTRELYRRALGQCPSISVDSRRQQGKPCIAGTRIPVHLVIWAVEQSGSIKGALKSYPDLKEQQVKDALYFAETVLGSPNVITEAALTA